MLFSGALFALSGRLRVRSAWHLVCAATHSVLFNGSMASLEALVAGADYDDFLAREMERMGKRDGGRRAGLVTALARPRLHERTLPASAEGQRPSYRSYYVETEDLARQGVAVVKEGVKRPVLLLAGTSLSNFDRKDFLGHLLWSGYEVAGVEDQVGGLFDVHINPSKCRPEALRDFLGHLRQEKGVRGVDIVAQSYSSFEVVRVLLAEPEWATFVKSVTLINPPGFDPRNNFVRHCARFLFGHVLQGYAASLGRLVWFKLVPNTAAPERHAEFFRREVDGINNWASKTFRNVVRTMREVKDISSFRIKEPLRQVVALGVPVYLFLQADDKLVPSQITREQVRDFLPDTHITEVPGGHTDLFFQPWQRDAFCHFLNSIRQTHP
jgi:hypothetical protein